MRGVGPAMQGLYEIGASSWAVWASEHGVWGLGAIALRIGFHKGWTGHGECM